MEPRVTDLLVAPHVYRSMVATKDQPGWWERMLVGEVEGRLRFTAPNTSLLVLGPPQSQKSSGVMVPLILSQTGPVVSTSVKIDVAYATGLARARQGTLWHFSPTEPTPSGFKKLRWSPIAAAKDWDVAQATALRMAKTTDLDSASAGRGDTKDDFWQRRAADLIAVLLHYASLKGLDMSYVVDNIASGQSQIAKRLGPLMLELRSLESHQAADQLEGLLFLEGRERGSVFSVATTALSAYRRLRAVESSKRVNFDPDEFVRSSDTIYITAPVGSDVAPIVVALIGEIRRAAYRQHREDQLLGVRRAPVTFALDELANIAPLPDIGEMISLGNEGVLTVGCLQDLSQARARYGEAAKGWMTLWGNVLLLNNIRDMETLDLASQLVGDYDRQIWTTTIRSGGRSKYKSEGWSAKQDTEGGTTYTQQWTKARRLPPDVISSGNPFLPNSALCLKAKGGWEWVTLLPYFRHRLWLHVYWEVMHQAYVVHAKGVPVPELARDDGGWYVGTQLSPQEQEHYWAMVQRLSDRPFALPTGVVAELGEHDPMNEIDQLYGEGEAA